MTTQTQLDRQLRDRDNRRRNKLARGAYHGRTKTLFGDGVAIMPRGKYRGVALTDIPTKALFNIRGSIRDCHVPVYHGDEALLRDVNAELDARGFN